MVGTAQDIITHIMPIASRTVPSQDTGDQAPHLDVSARPFRAADATDCST